MEYAEEFERDFMSRTLSILQDYAGPYDATLLLNCLLGLLIVPKETSIERIPCDPLSDLDKWGVKPSSIKSVGNPTKKNGNPDTLRGVVWNLRNAVAHFQVRPLARDQQCAGFEFKAESGFKAVLSLEEMKALVQKLASHLKSATSS